MRKLIQWFTDHPPFPEVQELISLSSGLVATDKVNCFKAYTVGTDTLHALTELQLPFSEVKLKKANKVTTLASVSNGNVAKLKKSKIDPLTFFNRLCLMRLEEEELKRSFQYELALYPLSLFVEGKFYRSKKSAMYSLFNTCERDITTMKCRYVIDGGFLLHRVVWPSNQVVGNLIDLYYEYIQKHYGPNESLSVVFDGYDEDGLKAAERRRRYVKKSPDIVFDASTPMSTIQDLDL